MSRKDDNQDSKNTSSFIALALWLIAAIVLLVLFIVNQKKIISNLKSTGFFGRIFGKTPAFVENAEVTVLENQGKNDVEPGSGVNIEVANGQEDDYSFQSGIISQNQAAKNGLESSASAKQNESGTENANAVGNAAGNAEVNEVPRTVNLKLYFMVINSDGSITRREVSRAMKKTGGPLVDAINALITGPLQEEESLGCTTLISNGTRLLGASVKNGVATLNFSGEFEFNQWGIEGTRGQLQQIVYTATAFPTVESVQFLIDGEQKDYLGSEGVWIGTPLNRNSF